MPSNKMFVCFGLLLGLAISLTAPAQESAPDGSDRFLLLATKKTKTMQKELNKAAAAGYRLKVGSQTSGSEVMVILQKTPMSAGKYEYLLLATTKSSTLQKEIDKAAASGFRILPRTMTQKRRAFGPEEIVVIMEKAPNVSKRYRYVILATSKTGTLQKEITQSTNEGFNLVALASRGEHFAIMERETDSPPE